MIVTGHLIGSTRHIAEAHDLRIILYHFYVQFVLLQMSPPPLLLTTQV